MHSKMKLGAVRGRVHKKSAASMGQNVSGKRLPKISKIYPFVGCKKNKQKYAEKSRMEFARPILSLGIAK